MYMVSRRHNKKEALSVQISAELARRLQNAAFWESGRLTKNDIVERGILSQLSAMELSRGSPYAPAPEDLSNQEQPDASP